MHRRSDTKRQAEISSPRKGAGSNRQRRSSSRHRPQSIPPTYDLDIDDPPAIDISTRSTQTTDPSHLEPPKRSVWIGPESTCLSFGLNSSFAIHKKFMCDNCIEHQEKTLTQTKKKNRSIKLKCKRPWDTKLYKDHNIKTKQNQMYDFHQFFNHPVDNVIGVGEIDTTQQQPVTPQQKAPVLDTNVDDVVVEEVVVSPHTVPTSPATEEEEEEEVVSHKSTQTEWDPTSLLFDNNLVLREDIAELITNTLTGRDMKEHPLQPHELRLLGVLLVDNNTINKHTTTIIEQCLLSKVDGAPLEETELRLLGQLVYKQLKHEDRIRCPSFQRFSKFDIVKVPETRVVQNVDKSNQTRLHRTHVKVATKWLGHLPGSFNDSFISDIISKNPKKVKYLIKEHCPDLFRMTPTETLAWQSFAKLSDNQIQRSGRALEFYGGLRLPAQISKVKALKKEYINKVTTYKQHKVELQKKIATGGKKNKKIFRDVTVTVTETRPLELIALAARENIRRGCHIKGEKRYNIPQHMSISEKFDDTVMSKFGIDAGNGSTKAITNLVNVDDPQSQKHVRVFAEFGGVKDSRFNVEKAMFDKQGILKKDIETVMNRRGTLYDVSINGQTEMVVVNNTDENHDRNKPQPLPELSGVKDYTPAQPESTEEPEETPKAVHFSNRVANIDVSKVSSIKLLHNTITKAVDGVCFEDSEQQTIGQCLFTTPIECQLNNIQPKIKQYLLMGIFGADLEFLSTFFGHQGASSKFFCMFCLAIKAQCHYVFHNAGNRTQFRMRTMEMMTEDGNAYKQMLADMKESEKVKYANTKKVTHQTSNSMTDSPMADFPMECVAPASMHVMLGIVPWIIKCMRKGYRKIEELEAAVVGADAISSGLREHIEWAIELAKEYEKYLEGELQPTITAMDDHDGVLAAIINNIHACELIEQTTTDENERSINQAILAGLRQSHDEYVNNMTHNTPQSTQEDKENEAHLMEQLFDCKKMREEFESMLLKHDGYASRVVGDVMHDKGVDEQIYHKGAIIGNHCMNFGKNGKDIVSGINEEMKSVINAQQHITYLDNFANCLNNIMDPLYKVLKVMKSVKKQSPTAINQFKEDTIELNKAIHKLVTDEPVPDVDFKLPTFLKSHLLFDYHLQDFLEMWGSLGAFSEENIESTHPIFNQLLRRYGNTRGWQLKRNVMKQFMVERATLVLESVDDMISATSKTKRPNTKKRGKDNNSPQLREDNNIYSPELSDMEKDMNNNVLLRCPNFDHDTKIVACSICGKRVLNFGLAIHNREYHSGNICRDVDNDVVNRMEEIQELSDGNMIGNL